MRSFNADLANQGLFLMHMEVWPGKINTDLVVYLHSLTTVLVILSLAECAYQCLTSAHKENCLSPTHYVLSGIMSNLHVWYAHHSPISDALASRVVVVWEKLVNSFTLILH